MLHIPARKIGNADGSLTAILGIGTIKFNSHLTCMDVLHVPKRNFILQLAFLVFILLFLSTLSFTSILPLKETEIVENSHFLDSLL